MDESNPVVRPAGAAAQQVVVTADSESLLGRKYRSMTWGIVGLVSLIAYEAMGNATVMPVAASELDGIPLYGLLFGGPLATSLVGMVAAGRWADEHSPLRSTWAGAACFVGGQLLAAFAPAMAWLLAGRLATGFGSGMLAVALYALVGRVYPTSLHARVFAGFSAAWVLPALLAPALSGGLAQAFGWRTAILLGVALTAPVLLLLAPLKLTPMRAHGAAGPDRRLWWACLAAVGALALHALGQGHAPSGQAELSPTLTAVLLTAATAALAVAAWRLLPPGTLVARHGLPAAIALSGLSQGAFFAAEAFIPLLLHQHRGVPIGVAGFALTAGAVSWSAGAMFRARVHERVTPARLLTAGFVLLSAGIVASALVIMPAVPFWVAPLGWAIAGAGMGLISPTLSVITLAMASPGGHGRVGASLRMSAAMSTTSVLALSGALFAFLLSRSPQAAFLTSLGIAALLGLAGVSLSGRIAVERPVCG